MSENESSEAASLVDESWVSWFCNLNGNHILCEVDKQFIEDSFNLFGLKQHVTKNFNKSLYTILDRQEGAEDDPEEDLILTSSLLYGMIHARYIITTNGLLAMQKKYQRKEFGECPRTYCNGQAVLPIGMADEPNLGSYKLFCPKCRDMYNCAASQSHVDGAYFGTSFPHIFLMTYDDLVPIAPTSCYTAKVFGFKIHSSSNCLPKKVVVLEPGSNSEGAYSSGGKNVASSADNSDVPLEADSAHPTSSYRSHSVASGSQHGASLPGGSINGSRNSGQLLFDFTPSELGSNAPDMFSEPKNVVSNQEDGYRGGSHHSTKSSSTAYSTISNSRQGASFPPHIQQQQLQQAQFQQQQYQQQQNNQQQQYQEPLYQQQLKYQEPQMQTKLQPQPYHEQKQPPHNHQPYHEQSQAEKQQTHNAQHNLYQQAPQQQRTDYPADQFYDEMGRAVAGATGVPQHDTYYEQQPQQQYSQQPVQVQVQRKQPAQKNQQQSAPVQQQLQQVQYQVPYAQLNQHYTTTGYGGDNISHATQYSANSGHSNGSYHSYHSQNQVQNQQGHNQQGQGRTQGQQHGQSIVQSQTQDHGQGQQGQKQSRDAQYDRQNQQDPAKRARKK